MSSSYTPGEEVSVDEQALEADGAEPMRPSVGQQVDAKVDANHPDARMAEYEDRIYGQTLEAEERIRAREEELARLSGRGALSPQADREARTRSVVVRECTARGEENEDPRERLEREELAAVNKQAARIHESVTEGPCRAAIARQLAERVAGGMDIMTAVFETKDAVLADPGTVVPIAAVEQVDAGEVTVAGTVEKLWTPSHPSIAQVGLIADESGQTRVTIWEKSNAPWIEEGEDIRIQGAAKNWYEGRVSLAVTGWSVINFPNRRGWWE